MILWYNDMNSRVFESEGEAFDDAIEMMDEQDYLEGISRQFSCIEDVVACVMKRTTGRFTFWGDVFNDEAEAAEVDFFNKHYWTEDVDEGDE